MHPDLFHSFIFITFSNIDHFTYIKMIILFFFVIIPHPSMICTITIISLYFIKHYSFLNDIIRPSLLPLHYMCKKYIEIAYKNMHLDLFLLFSSLFLFIILFMSKDHWK